MKTIGENVKGKVTLKMNSSSFYQILQENDGQLTQFKEKVAKEWREFKQINDARIIKKTFSTFFYQYFEEYFQIYLERFCGLEKASLILNSKEKVSDENLFLEYTYYISPKEESSFEHFASIYEDATDGYGVNSPFGYFYLIITILGVILRKILGEKFTVNLDGAIIKNGQIKSNIHFLIVIKSSKDVVYENYYLMFLYYFLRQIKEIPEDYFNKLLQGRERLYEIANDIYPLAKEKLVDLLYYFYKKCNLLENFSPLLDFMNFVCSRVEDSVFNKFDIIKDEFLTNLNYSNEKRNSLIKIFDFLDKKSTLYSTFQANNLPSEKSQLNLFLLYTKYYFGSGSLEALEVGDLLFLPEKFQSSLNKLNEGLDHSIDANSIKSIQKFLNYFSVLTNIENPNIFFQLIFKKDIAQMNYFFFKSFLRSLNMSIIRIIDHENALLAKSSNEELLDFQIIIEHVCRMLYVLIDKIFIRKRADQASKNFIDPRSRYIGKNIALRVLELFIFQDLNLSDDLWPDYMIALNKEELIEDLDEFNVKLPLTSFYNYDDIVRFVVTYNFHSFVQKRLFEEWLLEEIIIPLNNFMIDMDNRIKDKKNKIEIYEQLSSLLLEGITDKQLIKEIKFGCKEIAPFWET
ncbi:MAG: hypothetical protein ACFFKA_21860 [Candidatus Thorarchaeota archaeon]